MARLPRLAVAGALHLVVQQGHNRQPVFVDDVDRQTYLASLHDVLRAHGVAMHGYALLDTEVWLVLQPVEAAALSRTMQALGRRFVAAVNRRHARRGTLWDGRFRATVFDAPTQLVDVLVHLETKPVDAGLASSAGDWPWSSARHHLGLARDAALDEHPQLWALGNTPFERDTAWRRRLDVGLPAVRRRTIDDAALKGWALGPPGFVDVVAAQAGRPVQRRARGRPRKAG
ncbi:MAG: transposase [Gammaproteobacteria bacterium]|uniref:transposase n=1 Tax=Azohydromonas sp. TaxID=1872666 RepID=UPI002D1370DA|nr:transposase [Azohydromonas sp.]HMM84485.1 transposase [Azohydromonas sp.]